MRLQQELEQKQNEIASLDAAIQEKSIHNTDMASVESTKDNRSSLTLPNSVETVNDSLPTNTAAQVQSLTTQSPMITPSTPITPSTQMNTVALFHCADQILNGLKKTLKKDRALTPIDTNVTKEHSRCADRDKDNDLFHTPLHHVQATRPYSDQPRHNKKLSLLTHKKLNYSAELIPSSVVCVTTSGLTLCEIVRSCMVDIIDHVLHLIILNVKCDHILEKLQGHSQFSVSIQKLHTIFPLYAVRLAKCLKIVSDPLHVK